jgi:hypothetical protein
VRSVGKNDWGGGFKIQNDPKFGIQDDSKFKIQDSNSFKIQDSRFKIRMGDQF